MSYAELQVTTHFSFLRGASSAEELFAEAAMLGIPALGVVDRNSLAGIVRAHDAAKTTGVRLVVGCRLDLEDGTAMLVYPTDRAAYGRLCRLLSIGKGRAGKGACRLGWDDVAAWGEGQIVVFVPGRIDDGLAGRLRRLKSDFGDRAYLALTGASGQTTRCGSTGLRKQPVRLACRPSRRTTCSITRLSAGCSRMS
jgi:error-prone DNA polymerase